MFRLPPAARVLRVIPPWAEERSCAAPHGVLRMTLPQLWGALDTVGNGGRVRLSPVASDWRVDAALSGLDTAMASLPGAPRRAASAIAALRAHSVTTQALADAAAQCGAGAELLALMQRYEAFLARNSVDDGSAAIRQGLAVARGPAWPAPLSAIASVEVAAGIDIVGSTLALVQAMAHSGRAVNIDFAPAPAAVASGPTMGAAQPYVDAMLGVLEAGQAPIDVSFGDEPGGSGVPPSVQAWQAPGGSEFCERVVFEVAQRLASGTPAERIALVLPPSVPPMWRRRLVVRRLRALLGEAHIACQGGPLERLGDTPLGQLCTDVLSVAQQLSQAGAELSLAACGRILEHLAPGLEALQHWPRPSLDERVALPSLSHWLHAERGGAARDTQALAAAAQAVLQQWVWPLVQKPVPDALAHLLAIADAAELACATPPSAAQDAQRQALIEGLAALADAHDAASLADVPRGTQLAYLRRSLERQALRAPSGKGGVAILRPEDAVGGAFDTVMVLAANEQVWFRPPKPDPLLPEALVRALARAGACVLTPAASMVASRPLVPRDRAAWLWHGACAAAQTRWVACLLMGQDQAEAPCEPATEALLAHAGEPVDVPPLPPVALEPPAAQVCPRMRRQALAAAKGATRLPAGADLSLPSRAVLTQRLLGHELTASSLDELARCRFRYFAGSVLALSTPDRPTPVPSPRVLGQAMHRALKDAIDFEAQNRLPAGAPLPLAGAPLAQALAVAEARFYHDAALYLSEEDVHPSLRAAALHDVWSATRAQLVTALCGPAVLRRETELGFGGRHVLAPVTLHAPDGVRAVRVRGAIDRVDVYAHGCETLDYKHKRQSRVPHRHLQLGIYALAAGEHVAHGAPLRAAWLTLSGQGAGTPQAAPELSGSLAAVRAHVEHDAWARLGPLLEGNVSPDPAPVQSCRACSFLDLCQFSPADAHEGQDDDA